MSEHPGPEDESEHERDVSTDLGYRDTEEERAYEQAQESGGPPAGDDDQQDEGDGRLTAGADPRVQSPEGVSRGSQRTESAGRGADTRADGVG